MVERAARAPIRASTTELTAALLYKVQVPGNPLGHIPRYKP